MPSLQQPYIVNNDGDARLRAGLAACAPTDGAHLESHQPGSAGRAA
jgi:hypothetical protein